MPRRATPRARDGRAWTTPGSPTRRSSSADRALCRLRRAGPRLLRERARAGDLLIRDGLVERSHAGQLEAVLCGEPLDLDHLMDVHTTTERVVLEPVFEREDHRLGHARQRDLRRQAEIEIE